jgi:hypothetical protein
MFGPLPLRYVDSAGYSFGVELIFYLGAIGVALKEVPIHFSDRADGESKIPKLQILRSAWDVLSLTVSASTVDWIWCQTRGWARLASSVGIARLLFAEEARRALRFLEAVAVALARGYLAARHATPSVMFIVFLLGAVWRLTRVCRMDLLQIPLLGLAAAALIAMNASVYETEWRHLAKCVDQATHRFNGQLDKEWPCIVEQLAWPPTPETRKGFLELRLGPFAND